jgi:hypothetical protein
LVHVTVVFADTVIVEGENAELSIKTSFAPGVCDVSFDFEQPDEML